MSFGLFENLEHGDDSSRLRKAASRKAVATAVHYARKDFGAFLGNAADNQDWKDRLSQVLPSITDLTVKHATFGDIGSVIEALAASAYDPRYAAGGQDDPKWNFNKTKGDSDSDSDKGEEDDSDSDSDSDPDDDSDDGDTPDFVDTDKDDDDKRKESANGRPSWYQEGDERGFEDLDNDDLRLQSDPHEDWFDHDGEIASANGERPNARKAWHDETGESPHNDEADYRPLYNVNGEDADYGNEKPQSGAYYNKPAVPTSTRSANRKTADDGIDGFDEAPDLNLDDLHWNSNPVDDNFEGDVNDLLTDGDTGLGATAPGTVASRSTGFPVVPRTAKVAGLPVVPRLSHPKG